MPLLENLRLTTIDSATRDQDNDNNWIEPLPIPDERYPGPLKEKVYLRFLKEIKLDLSAPLAHMVLGSFTMPTRLDDFEINTTCTQVAEPRAVRILNEDHFNPAVFGYSTHLKCYLHQHNLVDYGLITFIGGDHTPYQNGTFTGTLDLTRGIAGPELHNLLRAIPLQNITRFTFRIYVKENHPNNIGILSVLKHFAPNLDSVELVFHTPSSGNKGVLRQLRKQLTTSLTVAHITLRRLLIEVHKHLHAGTKLFWTVKSTHPIIVTTCSKFPRLQKLALFSNDGEYSTLKRRAISDSLHDHGLSNEIRRCILPIVKPN